MELSNISDYNSSQADDTSQTEEEPSKTVKRVYINNDNSDDKKRSFDDSFEVK
ncbi:MAG TPA: hypothetical protein PK447_05110 [Ignavibacteria bacterium]|nr:hypothetical protein [Ignavibacteria bacterium]